MQRGNHHGPRQDDALKHDTEGMIRGNGPTRAEEWHDPEPPADDDPVLWRGESPAEQAQKTAGTG
jgi:hypothetical protein